MRHIIETSSTTPIRHTQHNATLDWLRGLAAISVVIYHLSERLDLPFIAVHGYLAVDFFFVLSGFVIAKAYEERLFDRTLSTGQFVKARAIRLLPMVVVGTLLAAVVEIGRPGIANQAVHLRDGITALVMGSVLIPVLWTTTLENTVFPLNGPMWTLFLEAVSNVAFIPWARRSRSRSWLYVSMTISLVTLIYAAFRYGDINLGAVPDTFFVGFARIGWSFPTGILLFHHRKKAFSANPAVIPLTLLLIFFVPDLGRLTPIFDLIAIIVFLPLVVWTAPRTKFDIRLAQISGNLSYPLYAVHYPLARMLGVVGLKLHISTFARLIFGLACLIPIILVSAMLFRYYDQPLRRRLSRQ